MQSLHSLAGSGDWSTYLSASRTALSEVLKAVTSLQLSGLSLAPQALSTAETNGAAVNKWALC